MQILKHTHDLSRVELRLFWFELANSPQISEHLTPSYEFDDQVQISIVLSKSFHCNDKGVIDCSKNIVFIHYVIYLFHFNNLCLFHNFYSYELFLS